MKLSWYDIKTKFKSTSRSVIYSSIFQAILSRIISGYIRFVIFTSRKSYINLEYIDDILDKNKSFIGVTWHNRLTLSPFSFLKSKNLQKGYKFHVLASKHGDGAMVGNVMNNLGFGVISGSTRKKHATQSANGGTSKNGINIGEFRKIFKILKGNNSFCITPDGPRGPRFKVGGAVIDIAKATGVPIIPAAYGISNRKIFNSWDRFILPIPFSKISFVIGKPIYIERNISDKELEKIKLEVEDGINFVSQESDKIVGKSPIIDK